MEYTAVIRTLGMAGYKYQRLLNSLNSQSVPPKSIFVYIAKGCCLPVETIGIEQYIYVDKGMLSQRALSYSEVETEYILFLDDDLEFPPDTVCNMFTLLDKYNADVISPDIFPNLRRPVGAEIMMFISGRMRARRFEDNWGYKIMGTAGYSYCKTPQKEALQSETNAGACFLCKKVSFLGIDLENELWVDRMSYPLGEDQIMYYKMHCLGLKQLTWYNHKFIHLDGGGNMTPEKEAKRLYGDVYFKTVFWHRFLYIPEKSEIKRLGLVICIVYYITFTLIVSLLRGRWDILNSKWNALKEAIQFIKSETYKSLPVVNKINE